MNNRNNSSQVEPSSGGTRCSGNIRPTDKATSQPLGNCNRNLKTSLGGGGGGHPLNREGDSSSGDENGCICFRKKRAYECGRCHHYFYGRLLEICPLHKEIFLMDFQRCPYCAAPTDQIKRSQLSWAEIRKIEEAQLPNGDDKDL